MVPTTKESNNAKEKENQQKQSEGPRPETAQGCQGRIREVSQLDTVNNSSLNCERLAPWFNPAVRAKQEGA